jgi:lipoyl(octanoyl) transferase
LFQDLGHEDYKICWERQEGLFNSLVEYKMKTRREPSLSLDDQKNYLLFVEHPPVYTLGKSGDIRHLLKSEDELHGIGASYYAINRGGDITFHGPGQIVGYPIFDLELFFTDIHRYLRTLEEAIILTLRDFGIDSGRIDGLTGVWIDPGILGKERKIAAMGVKCSRWITMHGFAFNVNTDLRWFDYIVPCGIDDKAVTSMQQELNGAIQDMSVVKKKLLFHLQEQFQFDLLE